MLDPWGSLNKNHTLVFWIWKSMRNAQVGAAVIDLIIERVLAIACKVF
ncbi:hypothetical protein [Serratia ficaria]|nr:hypothetical protein [Serratia ficaria]